MKNWIIPLMLGFGITLAFVIGQRMSTDAMAVVIGVAVGVTASVPTTLLILATQRREKRSWQTEVGTPPPAPVQLAQPNVIVLNPSDLLGRMGYGQGYVPMPPQEMGNQGGMRQLRVIGEDEAW